MQIQGQNHRYSKLYSRINDQNSLMKVRNKLLNTVIHMCIIGSQVNLHKIEICTKRYQYAMHFSMMRFGLN